MAISVLAKKNGPYLITGDLSELQITDADGNKYDITGKQAVALCRCGASVNKPFCDGQHSKIGFQAAEAAVKAEQL
jgi:3-phenylpropionate/trans-cinnamate dioxygenase ferredoxin subunit